MFNLVILFLSLQFASHTDDHTITWTAGWSHDDKYIATGNDKGDVVIYETTGWTKVNSWNHPGSTITKIEWNPKYPLLAVTGITKNGSVAQLYDIQQNKTVATLPDTVQGRAVTWKPDGEQVAFITGGGFISIYTKNGDPVKTLNYRHARGLFDMDWHPTQNLLLAVEENIHIIDIDRDIVRANFEDGTEHKGILCAQWHPSGQYFATGDYGHESEGGEPSFLKIWSPAGALQSTSANSKSEYRNIRWSNDGKYLAAAGDMLLLFDSRNKLKKIKLGKDNIWGLGWNATNDKIITGDQAGAVRICDIKGKVLRELK